MEEFISPNSLDKDLNKSAKQSEKYNFAFNAVIDSFSEENSFPFLSNAPSNYLSTMLSSGETLISFKVITEFNQVILFTKKEGTSYIKYFTYDNKEVYQKNLQITELKDLNQIPFTTLSTLVESPCLTFSSEYPTNLVYKLTETTLNLYFVDNTNQDRYIYFDYDSKFNLTLSEDFQKFTETNNCDITYTGELDCNSINWNSKINYPSLELDETIGGKKDKGKYSYLIAYATEKGIPLTEFKSQTEGISIYTDKEASNKAISIKIKSLSKNSRFRFFTIACVKSKNGQTSYYRVGTYPIHQVEVIDSVENEQAMSFEEISKVLVYYKSSRFIAAQNDILFRGGIKEYQKFNLQQMVNKVHLQWIKVKIKEGDYKDPKIAQQYRGYLSDENYIFGVKFILDNLEETPVFHIPGRSITSNDSIMVTNMDTDGVPTAKWKTYNTASKSNSYNVEYNKDTPNIVEDGEFGYYESTEKYPNIPEVWGNLCDQPIRLHKFPDITVSNFHSTNVTSSTDLFIHPLGIKLDDSIDFQLLLKEAVVEELISEEQRLRIKGYKLVRGNRSGNKSIVAKGLLYNVWSYQDDNEECGEGNTHYFPSYPFNDASDDDLIGFNKEHYDYNKFEENKITGTRLPYVNTGRYTFHSPDTSFVEPKLGDSLKLESEEYGTSKGFFNNSEDQAKQALLNKKHYNVAIVLGQWIGSTAEAPDSGQAAGVASNIGQTAGGIVGGLIPGIGGAIGSTIGSTLGGIIGGLVGSKIEDKDLNHLLYKNAIILAESEKFLQLFKLANKPVDLHKQYQAIGNYHNTDPVDNTGNKIREITTSGYLDSNRVNIQEEASSIQFNNWNRETSVYLKVKENLPTLQKDNSRIKLNTSSSTSTPIYSEDCWEWTINATNAEDNRFRLYGIDCLGVKFFIGQYKNDTITNLKICAREILIDEAQFAGLWDIKVKLGDLTTVKGSSCGTPVIVGYEKENCKCTSNERESQISSYYGSIKNNLVNQYNTIYDVNWLETHSDMKPLNKCLTEVIKPVNLISVKLDDEITAPKKHSVITDIECLDVTDPCALVVLWDDPTTFIVQCGETGLTNITVGVNGNANNIIQFSVDNINYFDANIGNNKYSYTTTSNGDCGSIWFRTKGCEVTTWGCVLAKTTEECNITTPPTPGDGSLGEDPCLVNCNEFIITNNNTNTTASVTYEDCINEEWQIILEPLQAITVCKKGTGGIIFRDLSGNLIGNISVIDTAQCENCKVYVQSMGGFPLINTSTKIHTRRFDPQYDSFNKTVTDFSTFMTSEVKEYKIDESKWQSTLVNEDLSGLAGRTVTISVRFRLNSTPDNFVEQYSAYINVE